jgi:hemolysin activation/secretion protein
MTALSALPLHALAAPEAADLMLEERRAAMRDGQLQPAAPADIAPSAPPLDADPAQVPEPGATLSVQRIEVDAAGLLTEQQIAVITARFLRVPLGRQRIGLLLRQLDARLVQRGWVTSRARLLSVDVERALLSVELVPGRIEAVRATGLTPAALERALPLAPGDVVSLEAIEQGVQQINRLRMYQARMRVLPGTSAGTSLLDILLAEGRSWSLAVGLDNQGQRSTGRGRTRVTARFGNALGWLDDIQLAWLHSGHSDAALASITVPAGFSLWSATVSASRAAHDVAGLDLHSRAVTAVLGWNRVLALTKEGRDSLDVSLSRSGLSRRLESVELRSEHNTVLRAAWTHVGRGPRHQYYIEPALSVGLPLFGATRDANELPRSHIHHAFTKWALAAGALVRSPGEAVEFAGQFAAQHSNTGLIGSEQLYLGGFATVRGFDESVLAGDSGHVIRTELRLPGLWAVTQRATVPYVHFDHGERRMVGGRRSALASVGAGLRGNGDGLVWEGVISLPVRQCVDTGRHGWRVHLSVNYAL